MTEKRVLIVEDEMILSLMLERMLKNMGHTIIDKVISGEQAVEKASLHRPDIILMDIRLQGEIDGIDAMSQIQQQFDIPVIYITANTDQRYKKRVESTSYLDFLIKLLREFNFPNLLIWHLNYCSKYFD